MLKTVNISVQPFTLMWARGGRGGWGWGVMEGVNTLIFKIIYISLY